MLRHVLLTTCRSLKKRTNNTFRSLSTSTEKAGLSQEKLNLLEKKGIDTEKIQYLDNDVQLDEPTFSDENNMDPNVQRVFDSICLLNMIEIAELSSALQVRKYTLAWINIYSKNI